MSTVTESPAAVLSAESRPSDITRAILGRWAEIDPYLISGALPEGQVEAECRVCSRRRLVSRNWAGGTLKCTRCDQQRAHEVHHPSVLADELRWRLAMLDRAGFDCMLVNDKAARLHIEVTDAGEVDGWFGVNPSLSPTAFKQHLRFIWNAVVGTDGLDATHAYRRDDEAASWWYSLTWEPKPGDVLV